MKLRGIEAPFEWVESLGVCSNLSPPPLFFLQFIFNFYQCLLFFAVPFPVFFRSEGNWLCTFFSDTKSHVCFKYSSTYFYSFPFFRSLVICYTWTFSLYTELKIHSIYSLTFTHPFPLSYNKLKKILQFFQNIF